MHRWADGRTRPISPSTWKPWFAIFAPAVSGLALIISAAILDSFDQELMVILIVLVVMTYTAGANSINDVLDLEIDKVNRPSRPIPSNNIERNKALRFSFFLFLAGSVLSLQLPPNAYFISVVVSMPLIVIYSTHLKSKPLIGNIAVSFIIGLSFIFCGTILISFRLGDIS